MKRPILTGIATLAIGLRAFGQGTIELDNSGPGFKYGVAIHSPGNYYTGTFGMEVWELNANSVPAGINGAGGLAAYNAMKAAGFKLEATFANRTMNYPGTVTLGEVDMPDVSPRGGTVVVGLAAWNTSAPSWSAMLVDSAANTPAGVVAFVNASADPTAAPPPVPADVTGWNSEGDLVMAILTPEPSTFALAGLGVAILWTFRRRN